MTTEKKKAPPKREDRPGHLDPKYAAALRGKSESSKDDDQAFVGRKHSKDPLAEEMGEGTVAAMTSGGDEIGDDLQAEVDEESGGPFVESDAAKEFAQGTDASNPEDAEREPLPKT